SLIAVATDPAIWAQLHDEQGEFLILKEDDFKDPRSSLAWSLLLTHADPDLRALAAQTHGHLTAAGRTGPPPASARANPAPPPAPAPGATQQGGAPSWLAGHIPQAQNTSAASGTGTSAGTGTAVGTGFARRRAADILTGVFALTGSAAPATLAAIGMLPTGPMP